MEEIIRIRLVEVDLGPFSERQVRDYLAGGLLVPTDAARLEMAEEWTALSDVLARLSQSSTTTPVEKASGLITAPSIPFFASDAIQPAVTLIAPTLPLSPMAEQEPGRKLPPEPVVPYNQPMPFPRTFLVTCWETWGIYVAVALVLGCFWMELNWSTVEPALVRFWTQLIFTLFSSTR